MYVPNTKAPAR